MTGEQFFVRLGKVEICTFENLGHILKNRDEVLKALNIFKTVEKYLNIFSYLAHDTGETQMSQC